MMELDEFHSYLLDNHDMHKAWGEVVSMEIQNSLKKILSCENLKGFLKLPVEPRVKDIKSAIGKVARKGYEDPINQMTDLVGTRFVVLLSTEIKIVCEALDSIESFATIVSKDYQKEILSDPKLFDYQSKHYEVRPKFDFTVSNITITKQACCEVQIRTLLQHAYAELVHDNIYKPVGIVPKSAERHIARSMALMETTDELFCSTMDILFKNNKDRNEFLKSLVKLFCKEIGEGNLQTDEVTNFHILDEYKEQTNKEAIDKVTLVLKEKKYLADRISKRAKVNNLFSQPSVLFVYYLGTVLDSGQLVKSWPLPGHLNDLHLIMSDLGIKSDL